MSTLTHSNENQISQKLGLSGLFLIATTSFFLGDHLLASGGVVLLTGIPTLLFLGITVFFYKKVEFHRYWEVAFAFFCGSTGLFLAWNIPEVPLAAFGTDMDTPKGVTILKFFELLPVALAILVLTGIVQKSLHPIYIQRGNFKSGLGLGLLLSLLILVVYLIFSWSRIDPAKAIPALPWLFAFALLNAFFEELLLRGLFLKRYIALLGARWGIVLSALCYGLFFLGVQSAVGTTPYPALVVILPLGVLYGLMMYNAKSIWGPVSIHAAIDLVFLLGVFAST